MSRIFVEPFDLLPSTAITSTTNTDAFEGAAFGPLAIMVVVTNAAGLTASITVEAGPDKVLWATVSDSTQAVTGDVVHLYDYWAGAGGSKYTRVKFTVSAGTCTLRVILSGMRYG